MNQLYSIGEQVLRQAPNYPECNGEYKIVGIISSVEMQSLHPVMSTLPGNYYELEGLKVLVTNMSGIPTGTISRHTHESFLRKIHKPSTQSFTEMMSVLKMPNKVWERV
jgi:hypothetical protein